MASRDFGGVNLFGNHFADRQISGLNQIRMLPPPLSFPVFMVSCQNSVNFENLVIPSKQSRSFRLKSSPLRASASPRELRSLINFVNLVKIGNLVMLSLFSNSTVFAVEQPDVSHAKS